MNADVLDRLARYGGTLDEAILEVIATPDLVDHPSWQRRPKVLLAAVLVVALIVSIVIVRGFGNRRDRLQPVGPATPATIVAATFHELIDGHRPVPDGAIVSIVRRADGTLGRRVQGQALTSDVLCSNGTGSCYSDLSTVLDVAVTGGSIDETDISFCCRQVIDEGDRPLRLHFGDGSATPEVARLETGFGHFVSLVSYPAAVVVDGTSPLPMLADDVAVLSADLIAVLSGGRRVNPDGPVSITILERSSRGWSARRTINVIDTVSAACGLARVSRSLVALQIGAINRQGQCVGTRVERFDLDRGQAVGPVIDLPVPIWSLVAVGDQQLAAATTDGRSIVSDDSRFVSWSVIASSNVVAVSDVSGG